MQRKKQTNTERIGRKEKLKKTDRILNDTERREKNEVKNTYQRKKERIRKKEKRKKRDRIQNDTEEWSKENTYKRKKETNKQK